MIKIKGLTILDYNIYNFIKCKGYNEIVTPKEIQNNIDAPHGGKLSPTVCHGSLNRLMNIGLVEHAPGKIKKQNGYRISQNHIHSELTQLVYFNEFIKNNAVLDNSLCENIAFQHSIYGIPSISDLNEYEKSIILMNFTKLNRIFNDLLWLKLSIEIRKKIDEGIIPNSVFPDGVNIEKLANIWENAMEWPREFDSSNDIYDKYDQDFKQGYGCLKEPIYQVLFWISCKTDKIFNIKDFDDTTEIALLSTLPIHETDKFFEKKVNQLDCYLNTIINNSEGIFEKKKVIWDIVKLYNKGFYESDKIAFKTNKKIKKILAQNEIDFMIKFISLFTPNKYSHLTLSHIYWYSIFKSDNKLDRKKLNKALKRNDQIIESLKDNYINFLLNSDIEDIIDIIEDKNVKLQLFFQIIKQHHLKPFELLDFNVENYNAEKSVLKIIYSEQQLKLSKENKILVEKVLGKRETGPVFISNENRKWTYGDIIFHLYELMMEKIMNDFNLNRYLLKKYLEIIEIEEKYKIAFDEIDKIINSSSLYISQ